MKRRIKLLINWILQFDLENIVAFSISGLLGIAITIVLFVSTDKVPAAPFDYEQLEAKVNAIEQNPELLLKTNCNTTNENEVLIVTFESNECKMTAKYNKDFEVLSTSKEDKSVFWLFALAASLLLGAWAIIIFGGIFAILIALLEVVVKWIKSSKLKISKKYVFIKR